MVKAVRIERNGGPEVLRLHEAEYREPGPGEAWIEHEAIGVNYLDVMQRSGAVSTALPSGLGLEAAGRVTAVGAGVHGVKPGDRIAYALGPLGAYSSGRLYPAERLVRLPDELSAPDAAAILFKGLTAQYLIKSTYPVGGGDVVLLYGAAGGVGQILARWASRLGAKVIGVVSKEASVARAEESGCAHVLVWSEGELPAQVARLTDGRGVDVVYDGVGRRTFDASLESLRTRGMMVSMGASSGVPEPVSVATLNRKSLFLTRPSLAAHVTDPAEYHRRVDDVLAAAAQGIVRPSVWKTFPLGDAALAHAALEDGTAAGTILLLP